MSLAAGLLVAGGAGGLVSVAGGLSVSVCAGRLVAAVAAALLFPQPMSSRASRARIEKESVSLNCDLCDAALAIVEVRCAPAREEDAAR